MRAAGGGGEGPKPFPWGTAMTLGFHRLRLLPEVFWRLSLPEFVAMSGGFDRPGGISRAEVERMMSRFPD
ncbi:phage tail assembly chaperone [Rhizobium sp. AG855]|uniref:phage tail assembly chaperone n=1 Tax=Rhizobium sp. AG855 TaxID=2183898 RepID=UPI000FF1D09C|nr:phage tail assembly chaperone [Rhizobium sp. AG855]RKE85509.1 putative phage protein (TIGR02216 family) [Rhizobium sp. AG855]